MKTSKILILALALLLGVSSLTSCYENSALAKRLDEYNNTINSLEAKIDDLTAIVAKQGEYIEQLQNSVVNKETYIEDVKYYDKKLSKIENIVIDKEIELTKENYNQYIKIDISFSKVKYNESQKRHECMIKFDIYPIDEDIVLLDVNCKIVLNTNSDTDLTLIGIISPSNKVDNAADTWKTSEKTIALNLNRISHTYNEIAIFHEWTGGINDPQIVSNNIDIFTMLDISGSVLIYK